jgi:glycosidase
LGKHSPVFVLDWWRSAVIYEIYTPSFFDSDGDGNGDLNGVIQKIDYLDQLGVDAIWLTPFFKSPGRDQGYDPASYHQVDPRFGNNSDLCRLVRVAHERGIRVILDLVINHTSNQHPWFLYSLRTQIRTRRASSGYEAEADALANLYIFRPENPEVPDQPPNNWRQFMADESAWTKTSGGEWYLHKFLREQPNLNLWNPLVRRHLCQIAERWIEDQGIDGIRLDIVDHVFQDKLLRDFEPTSKPVGDSYLDRWDWPACYLLEDEAVNLAKELSSAIRASNRAAVSIAEIHYSERVSDFGYYGRFYSEGEVDLPFNFSLLNTVIHFGADGRKWKTVIDRYLGAIPQGACPNFVLSNHDQTKRLVDMVGRDNIRAVIMALLCLGDGRGGSTFVYYGDEIGMTKGNAIGEANMKEPIGRMQGIDLSRDHVRAGLTWSTTRPNSGYSDNPVPWLPGGQTISGDGIAEQTDVDDSQLGFTRDIIALRRQNEALRFGEYVPYETGDDEVFCFGREVARQRGQRLLMLFNFSPEPKTVDLSPEFLGNILRSTVRSRSGEGIAKQLSVRPHEGCVISLKPP